MGTNIIVGRKDDGKGAECACYYDSVTDTVFGVLMNSLAEASEFEDYMKDQYEMDLRVIPNCEFESYVNEFRGEKEHD